MEANRVAIVGGGAAGFFLAVQLKEMVPEVGVTIFESADRVLRKVKVSGGGRCNVTNSFASVTDLRHVYPRGYRLMQRLMRGFSHEDTYSWWEQHGVRLVTQDDDCVFPRSQNSQEIIDTLLSLSRRYGVEVKTRCAVNTLSDLSDYTYICMATGGLTPSMVDWLRRDVCSNPDFIVPPVPSLFSFSVRDSALNALAGLVVDCAVRLPGTSFSAQGPLLITHWGVSGPAILRLSSYAARYLNEHGYQATLAINWLAMNEEDVRALVARQAVEARARRVMGANPTVLPARLWEYLVAKALSPTGGMDKRWGELSKKEKNRLVATLVDNQQALAGRAPHRDEFVTAGGVSLTAIDPKTLECRHRPNLFFAGEMLDLDGVTGGFNFQAAWTTAHAVAQSIADRIS